MKTVLDKLISKDQSGFIYGHYIGENTRVAYELMQLVEEKKSLSGRLPLIDFEKTFDSLSWSFVHKVLFVCFFFVCFFVVVFLF